MNRFKVVIALLLAAQTPAERLAKWKFVEMPLHSPALAPRERQMVEKLVKACQLLNQVFWLQSDREGLAIYQSTKDPVLKALFGIMGSRWDLIDENRPFYGEAPMPPGHELYPRGVTRAAIERSVKQHP